MRISPRVLRFVLVGVLNTAIDFAVLFALTSVGVELWLANTVSTSVALVFSFVVNRSFTFNSDENPWRQILPFIAVTLTGLWVLQPAILLSVTGLLTSSWGEVLSLFVAKILATVVSMTWNYLLYNRVVFRGSTPSPTDTP